MRGMCTSIVLEFPNYEISRLSVALVERCLEPIRIEDGERQNWRLPDINSGKLDAPLNPRPFLCA